MRPTSKVGLQLVWSAARDADQVDYRAEHATFAQARQRAKLLLLHDRFHSQPPSVRVGVGRAVRCHLQVQDLRDQLHHVWQGSQPLGLAGGGP